jgi:hypothetical protein
MKTRKQTKKLKVQHEAIEHQAITPIEYGGLQEAYDYLNKALFGGALPDVFITYQRRANSKGYFSADRFSGRGAKLGRHELALNPDAFIGRSDQQICSTLVHEQCHVGQHHSGHPSAGSYPQQGVGGDHEVGRTAAIIDRCRRRQGDRTSRLSLHHPRWSVR